MAKPDFSKIVALLVGHIDSVQTVVREVQEAIEKPSIKEEAEAVEAIANLVGEVAGEVEGK